MDDKVNKILNEYYNDYDEDSRLVKDKAHSIEYITTKKVIEEYLFDGCSILEIGAGTGRYSIYYADKGYKVTSVELIDKHLDILKSKIKSNMDINTIKGNCIDLKDLSDNSYDLTLVLGPMYHLYNDSDIKKAIAESIRVTKKNGIIIYAYITDDAVILSYGIKKGNMKRLKEISDDNWNLKKIEEEIFATYKVKDFDKLFNDKIVESIKSVSADGLSLKLRDEINNLSDEEFDYYLDYHLKNCEREDLLSYSSHVLKVVKKI